jgi:hypothetical protein
MSHEHLSIQGLPEEVGNDRNVQKVSQKMEYGQALQRLVDPNNYLGEVSRKISRENVYPIFYSNHNQHLNIAGMRKVYQSLSSRPKDLYVAIAYSLVNGGQNAQIINFARGLMPTLGEERTHLVPLARPKDIISLREEQGKEEAKKALRSSVYNRQLINKTLNEDAGLILFPEATTEGAVKDKKGKRRGMIKVEGNFVEDFVKEASEIERQLLFVPIGMVDTNRIVEPRTSRPHLRAAFEIGKEKVADALGVDFGPIKEIASIVVGEPFYPDEIDNRNFNFDLMSKVAELLPEEARGFYGESGSLEEHELVAGKSRRLFEY